RKNRERGGGALLPGSRFFVRSPPANHKGLAMSRSLLFTLYHLLLVTLILAAQAGCTSMLRHGKGSLADDPLLASSRSESLTAAIAKGLNYERSGQYDKARDAYEQALRDYPGEVEPLHR